MSDTEPPIDLDVPAGSGIRARITGPVATITLDRPQKRNAQTPEMWSGLAAVAAELPGTVRVVVLRGAGPSFSAGLDRAALAPGPDGAAPGILALAQLPADEAVERVGAWQRAIDWTSQPGVVSVAAVQGHAIGAGFQLALGADIRILADDASFVMAEPTLGLVPDLGGTKRLVELVGYSRAAEICLTGRAVRADEALRLGLASHVVPAHELDDAVDRTVAALLATDRDAATETKALLLAAARRTQEEQQRAEVEAQHRRLRALAGLEGES